MSGFFTLLCVISVPISISFLVTLIQGPFGGGKDFSDGAMLLGSICTLVVIIGILRFVENERRRSVTKGRECRAVCLDGLPGIQREQLTNLALDMKNEVILIKGLKDSVGLPKHLLKGKYELKETDVCLRFRQITRLNYTDWEGDVTRYVPGTSGVSYPGIFEGTRYYEPPTPGYFKTEALRVSQALEIRYRDQGGVPQRVVLDISGDSYYAQALLESLCRCTRLPAPQYVPPAKPAPPGPRYL